MSIHESFDERRARQIAAYVAHVRAQTVASSGSEGRADVAAQEAQAQATGAYGPRGVAAFRAYLVQTGELDARHIVAQASQVLGNGASRGWSRWTDGKTSYVDTTYDYDARTRAYSPRMAHVVEAPAPAGLKWVDTITLRPIEEAG